MSFLGSEISLNWLLELHTLFGSLDHFSGQHVANLSWARSIQLVLGTCLNIISKFNMNMDVTTVSNTTDLSGLPPLSGRFGTSKSKTRSQWVPTHGVRPRAVQLDPSEVQYNSNDLRCDAAMRTRITNDYSTLIVFSRSWQNKQKDIPQKGI